MTKKTTPTKVAFNGRPGAWSEAAAIAFSGLGTQTSSCRSPAEVLRTVEEGKADRGIVAVEHSLTGSVHQNYDLLLDHQLQIVGEIFFPIAHCLVAHPGAKLASIGRIYSHPHALEQCRTYLGRLDGVSLRLETDTGGAVARIKRRGLMNAAAIASERAAEIYDMKVLARNVEDPPANVTRFLLLGRDTPKPPVRRAKTSIVFAVKDLTRHFFSCLSLFALREIPLSKVESRPVRGRTNQLLFYLDADTSSVDTDLEEALAQLREIAPWVRVLGCYTRGKRIKMK
jgi:prephenate dehydratase